MYLRMRKMVKPTFKRKNKAILNIQYENEEELLKYINSYFVKVGRPDIFIGVYENVSENDEFEKVYYIANSQYGYSLPELIYRDKNLQACLDYINNVLR